jgi:hypothetical protein
MVPKKITEKFTESYTVQTYKPEDENTHHAGGKKENRNDEEDEDDEMNGGKQNVRCAQQ